MLKTPEKPVVLEAIHRTYSPEFEKVWQESSPGKRGIKYVKGASFKNHSQMVLVVINEVFNQYQALTKSLTGFFPPNPKTVAEILTTIDTLLVGITPAKDRQIIELGTVESEEKSTEDAWAPDVIDDACCDTARVLVRLFNDIAERGWTSNSKVAQLGLRQVKIDYQQLFEQRANILRSKIQDYEIKKKLFDDVTALQEKINTGLEPQTPLSYDQMFEIAAQLQNIHEQLLPLQQARQDGSGWNNSTVLADDTITTVRLVGMEEELAVSVFDRCKGYFQDIIRNASTFDVGQLQSKQTELEQLQNIFGTNQHEMLAPVTFLIETSLKKVREQLNPNSEAEVETKSEAEAGNQPVVATTISAPAPPAANLSSNVGDMPSSTYASLMQVGLRPSQSSPALLQEPAPVSQQADEKYGDDAEYKAMPESTLPSTLTSLHQQIVSVLPKPDVLDPWSSSILTATQTDLLCVFKAVTSEENYGTTPSAIRESYVCASQAILDFYQAQQAREGNAIQSIQQVSDSLRQQLSETTQSFVSEVKDVFAAYLNNNRVDSNMNGVQRWLQNTAYKFSCGTKMRVKGSYDQKILKAQEVMRDLELLERGWERDQTGKLQIFRGDDAAKLKAMDKIIESIDPKLMKKTFGQRNMFAECCEQAKKISTREFRDQTNASLVQMRSDSGNYSFRSQR